MRHRDILGVTETSQFQGRFRKCRFRQVTFPSAKKDKIWQMTALARGGGEATFGAVHLTPDIALNANWGRKCAECYG